MRISPHPIRLDDYGNLYRPSKEFYLNLNLYFLGFVHISHLLSVVCKRRISLTVLFVWYYLRYYKLDFPGYIEKFTNIAFPVGMVDFFIDEAMS